MPGAVRVVCCWQTYERRWGLARLITMLGVCELHGFVYLYNKARRRKQHLAQHLEMSCAARKINARAR